MISQITKPLVSVIVPSYNHEKYISNAIESVRAQTFTNWELIIVDDGSSDNSLEIIKRFASLDSRIRYFSQKNNDAPYTINRGMRESIGEYIAILNSDDAFEPKKLEESVVVLSQGADFVFGKMHVIDNNNITIDDRNERVKWINEKLNNSHDEASLKKILLNINYIVTTTNFVFKRELLKTVGFFHEKLHYGHDYNFLIRAYQCGVIIKFIPEYHSLYRIHSDNTISKGYAESLLEAGYSIARFFRSEKSKALKMDVTALQDHVMIDTVKELLKLSDEDMEEVINDKLNGHRLEILSLLNKKIKKSQNIVLIKQFSFFSLINRLVLKVRSCIPLGKR